MYGLVIAILTFSGLLNFRFHKRRVCILSKVRAAVPVNAFTFSFVSGSSLKAILITSMELHCVICLSQPVPLLVSALCVLPFFKHWLSNGFIAAADRKMAVTMLV